ncbi:MAG: 6,7-dimethyl-8-ribityllumazine synthase [Ancalomicrobiaceae bacterium]|nr:6,7-dimethyl-8-ribityllumazine synthase [Ancalomicrobiaceae bacterium]
MSTKHYHAAFEADAVKGARVLVVEARFYEGYADALQAGARAVLDAADVAYEIITVPGALEIPAVIAAATAGREPFDGYVALGTVIRGATTHYEIVSNESSHGLMNLATAHGLAIGNGILTVENDEQAWERADPSQLDKGGGAAAAALAMIAIRRRFGL